MTLICEFLLFQILVGIGVLVALFARNLISKKLSLSNSVKLVLQVALFWMTVTVIGWAWVYYAMNILPKLNIPSDSALGFVTLLTPLFVTGVIAAIFNKVSGYK